MNHVTDRNMRIAMRGPLFPLFYLLLVLLAPLLMGASSFAPLEQANVWAKGSNVGLSKGTQIRQGPSFDSCYHTIVPENNWSVQVIGGPTTDASGNVWYNTSRAAAGDPSGGTGWVRQAQADSSSPPHDPGIACPNSQASKSTGKLTITVPDFLTQIKIWWTGQAIAIKIGVLVGALLLLILVMRWGDTDSKAGGANASVLGFVRAILIGILLGGVADLTRPIWESSWASIAGDLQGVDPAIVLFVLPLMWFIVNLILSLVGRTLAIVAAVIQLVFLLLYLFPDRMNGVLAWIEGLFGGAGK
ncbi:MAG: hypothetical protein ABJA50_08860 [Chloroflexota bacterium]